MRRLIAALLLAVFPISAKPTSIALEWSDFRQVVDHVHHREKITIRSGPDGRERIRGRLVEISDAGITISKNGLSTGVHTFIERKDVHSVRITPRRGNPWKWKTVAILAAVPLWFAGVEVGQWFPEPYPEGRWWKNRNAVQSFVMSFGLPVAMYFLGQRADRRGGSIIVELEEGKEDLK